MYTDTAGHFQNAVSSCGNFYGAAAAAAAAAIRWRYQNAIPFRLSDGDRKDARSQFVHNFRAINQAIK